MEKIVNIFWFRRDLRLFDNHGLWQALKSDVPVLPVFIFDPEILSKLEIKRDARVTFIHKTIIELKNQIKGRHSDLRVYYGNVDDIWRSILQQYKVVQVFANADFEPYGMQRDARLQQILADAGVTFRLFTDHVIHEPGRVLKADGKPYTIFTPFSKVWLSTPLPQMQYDSEGNLNRLAVHAPTPVPELSEMGFEKSNLAFPPKLSSIEIIENYANTRNIPELDATSKLGLHLRFGTISVRALVQKAMSAHEHTFLNQLIWREFFIAILWHFPHVEHGAFKPQYDGIIWRNNESDYEAWCRGETGFPLVDAGMRQLAATGYMHNRVRMVTASFLTKHLLIDWRWGEAWFARHLLDFELANNNGGWQWAAGTGCDAAPYFRVFNPTAQATKFDPQQTYIRQWVPELGTVNYRDPIVDHNFARLRAISTYKAALGGA